MESLERGRGGGGGEGTQCQVSHITVYNMVQFHVYTIIMKAIKYKTM